MINPLRSRVLSFLALCLAPCLALCLVLLAVACGGGGGGSTSYPGPEPLTLTVEEPAEGVVLNDPDLILRGTVSEVDAFVACQGKEVAVDAQGRFEAKLQLELGPNAVTLQAWHAEDAKEGRGSGLLPPQDRVAARVVRTLVYQKPGLGLTVHAPADGAHFTASRIAVAGTVSDAGAAVSLNGAPLAVADTGHFQGTTELKAGSNTLTFRATASGDRSASETRTVTYTPVIPGTLSVAILNPAEGLLTNAATLQVSGTVSDPSATLTVQGQSVTAAPSGTWSLTLTPPEGPVTITAQALKGALSAQDERHIMVDRTPPVITLTRPVPAEVQSPTLNLAGRVDDPTAMLTLQQQPLSLDGTGAFATQVGLSEGPNTLRFRAVDPAGNIGTLDASTTYTPPGNPPVVVFDTPMDGYSTNVFSVLVQGHVDDPKATLVLQGEEIPLDAQGRFERTLNASKPGVLAIRAEATNRFGTGQSGIYVRFDTAPPVLAWAEPTPPQGAKLSATVVPAAVLIDKAALTTINGQRTELEPSDTPGMPFQARAEVEVQEGRVVLTATAVDAAGNQATLTRDLDIGFTAPRIIVDAPAFDASGRFTTSNVGTTLTGSVSAPEIVKPIQFTVNGQPVALTPEGRFSLPMGLTVGENPARLSATSRFGQSDARDLVIVRTPGVEDPGPATEPGIAIDWPLDGFTSGTPQITVKGRVRVPGMTATLNGAAVPVDPPTLAFTGIVALNPGANTIQAIGTDAQGRTAQAQVQGRHLAPGTATYSWLTPMDGARSRTRAVAVTGRADQPGILTVTVNGIPMTLDPLAGTFSGEVPLAGKGRNALVLQATALSGEALAPERREVIFQPDLPLIRLIAPEAARPGATVPIQVLPEAGTNLVSADLSFGDRLLARVTAPFGAQQALIPSDAAIGSRIPVDAVGTDSEGETVTARAYITVYGAGALLQQVVNDRTGQPLAEATVAIEDGETGQTDTSGRAALTTALPTSWIRVSKAGFTPVWRSAGLKQAGAEAALDARLTPLDVPQAASGSPLAFGKGAMTLTPSAAGAPILAPGSAGAPTLAPGSAGEIGATPLSAQGLPGLLPAGWSAVSAWWVTGEALPAAASVMRDVLLPEDAVHVWARWSESTHQWIALRSGTDPSNLPVPEAGGYALLLADPAPTAPPAAVDGEAVPAYAGTSWREGFTFSTGKGPQVMSTAEAIRGARMEARLQADFGSLDPVPSGLPVQAELGETYTLLDERIIEPESFTQDLVAHRWALTVVEGAPVLEAAGSGLLVKHPVRMSRSFEPGELVQGRLVVGYYHDGVRVADTGSGLVGSEGGRVSSGGLTVSLPGGAVTGTALIRITPDSGDLAALWPELAGKGELKRSFQIDVVGTLLKGLGLSLDSLEAADTARPILVQRRVVQGQRLTVAVGELVKAGASWNLAIPEGGNPILEGGSFAVVVSGEAWDWVSGTAVMPAAMAQPVIRSLGAKAALRPLASSSSTDVTVADASVDGGEFLAVSGTAGSFAVPVRIPTPAAPVTIQGSRWDLGLRGTLQANVPSVGQELRLATVPFRVETLVPLPGTAIPPATVFQVLTSGPADSASIPSVNVFKGAVEVLVRRSLSQDGRTLLITPDQPLTLGETYRLVTDGLKGLNGETAPRVEQPYTVQAAPPLPNPVDFSKVKLSYPDASFTVTITIPEGAVPPRAKVEVEAPGMGSVGTGVMPDSGSLAFTLRASLGERLKIQAQLLDGRVIQGFLSRYEAGDGSGRVTVGVDGGRVEAADGKAAATFPEGALDGPVEVRVEFTKAIPAELDPELAAREKIAGRIRLLTSEMDVQLRKRPILEILAPENPSTAQHTDGLGAYAVFDRVEGFDEDGAPCTYFELSDTAALAGTVLKSMGGIPENLSIPLEGSLSSAGVKAQVPVVQGLKMSTDMGPGRGSRPAPSTQAPVVAARSAAAAASGKVSPQSMAFGGGFGWMLDAMMIDSGPHYISGFAKIVVGLEEPKPAIGASIYFAKSGGSALKKGGQLLGHTLPPAGSYIYASSLTDELVRGGGQIMGVDKDFGVRAFSGSSTGGPGGIFGTYIHMPTLWFDVGQREMGDHVAPWAELRFEGSDVISDQEARNGTEVFATVNAYDTRDKRALQVEVSLDGSPMDPRAYQPGTSASGAGKWQIRLCNWLPAPSNSYIPLAQGVHVIEAVIADQSGNRSVLRRELRVLDFGANPPNDPSQPPRFAVETEGGLDAAKPSTMVRVRFTEPVTGVDGNALLLEGRNTLGAWERVSGVGLTGMVGTASASQTLATVYLIPSGKLTLGGWYRVRATSQVRDLDVPPKACVQGPVEFQVSIGQDLGTTVVKGGIAKIAALGNRVFVASNDPARSQITMLRVADASALPVAFGVTGSGGDDFLGQQIDAMKVFRQVAIDGYPTDLLLVTTSPKAGNSRNQGVLWAFNACSGLGTPRLMFGVSIGQGASGYAPDLDCRDGLIVVGRLTSSVLLIDASRARQEWLLNPDLSACKSPGGHNQQAIVQPFYLADPEKNSLPSHWGVGLVPDAVPGKDAAFSVVAGYSHPGAQWRGITMRGLPSIRYAYSPNMQAYLPEPPFMPDPESEGGGNDAPAANRNAVPGPIEGSAIGEPVPGSNSATRLSVWSRTAVEDNAGNLRMTNLVFAVSSLPVTLSNGSVLGNSVVVMEKQKDEQARLIAAWPVDPPFGPGVSYEILRKCPSVDPATGLVAIGVQNRTTSQVSWFVVDFKRPTKPKTVFVQGAAGINAALSNGILSTATGNGSWVQSTGLVESVGHEEGTVCGVPQLTIRVSYKKPKMDVLTRDERGKIIGSKFLFGNSDLLDVPGRRIQVRVEGGGVSLDGYTDDFGAVSFSALPPGNYNIKVIANYSYKENDKIIAEAGVYKYDWKDTSDTTWKTDSKLYAYPVEGKAITFDNSQEIQINIPVSNSQLGRTSAPWNILMVYDQTMKLLQEKCPNINASMRMHFLYYMDDNNGLNAFSGGLFKNGIAAIRLSGQYPDGTNNAQPSDYVDNSIAHEIGHFITCLFAASQTPGGNHYWNACDGDWTLTMNEALSDLLAINVCSQARHPQPHYDRIMPSLNYEIDRGYSLRDPARNNPSLQVGATDNIGGPWSELAIGRTLWRIQSKAFNGDFEKILSIWKDLSSEDLVNIYTFWRKAKLMSLSEVVDSEMVAGDMLDIYRNPVAPEVGTKLKALPGRSNSFHESGLSSYLKEGDYWKNTTMRYYYIPPMSPPPTKIGITFGASDDFMIDCLGAGGFYKRILKAEGKSEGNTVWFDLPSGRNSMAIRVMLWSAASNSMLVEFK